MEQQHYSEPTHASGGAALTPRRLAVGYGWQWISDGFDLFRSAPLPMIGMVLVWVLIVAALNFIPLVGPLAATVLAPVLFGGYMLACHKLAQREPITTAEVFSGFSRFGGPLALVGVLYLAGLFLISLATAIIVTALGMPVADPAAAPNDPALLASFGISLVLSIPLIMALWFAPALVALNRQPPATAMKLSFQGAAANLATFLLYLLISLVLTALAALPFFLGFILWGPVALASAYIGYRDIFLHRDTG
ncbi:hypothetical protein CAI21_00250 [Alkalilimnicola ehrlichii]|uniref:Transmembrane protein n=1 Tax=Alkalilimnicola ehrlichii TaxID=351052 RepID=A0A3E0X1Q3_9GAMM|nr:BPSS1780 family membrane protein [Alkalilimnicola ehrlichii]RFA31130.1 hypothetical protein CAI21_00250 [Alkalilimnicola ehrlichii]RFA39583.1 hypothetical protein CAL65_02155 [Alkalilimnicola ehrlichii]